MFLVGPSLAFGAAGDFVPNNDSAIRVDGLVNSHTPAIDGVGTTPAESPGGTGTSIEFNLFRDDTFFAWLKRQVTSTNRSSAIGEANTNDVESHLDERDFLAARKVQYDLNLDDDEKYEHALTGLTVGDEIKVMLYMHNNASHSCGGANTATSVTAALDWSDKVGNDINLVGSIDSLVANPNSINDTVNLTFDSSDRTLKTNSITILEREDPDGTPTGVECGSTNTGWVTSAGADTDVAVDTVTVDMGDIDGSYGNVHIVVFGMEVIASATPDFTILKEATPDPITTNVSPGTPGTTVTFDITVANTGGVLIENVELTDVLNSKFTYASNPDPAGVSSSETLGDPGGTVTLDFGDVALGASETLSFDVTVNNTAVSGDEICNETSGFGKDDFDTQTTATIESNRVCYDVLVAATCGNGVVDISQGEECDDGNANDTDGCSNICEINTAGISIAKIARDSGDTTDIEGQTVAPESQFIYRLTVTNTGEQTLNSGQVTDVILAGFEYDETTDVSSANYSGTTTFTKDGGTNELTVDYAAALAPGATDIIDILVTVDQDVTEGLKANTAVVTANALEPDSTSTFEVTDSDAVNVNVDPNCGNGGTLETGETCDDGRHCSNGDICSVDGDCTGTCEVRSGDGCDDSCLVESVSLSLVKYGNDPISGATVTPGDSIEYRLEVTNNGITDATTVTITDKLESNLRYVSPLGDAVITHSDNGSSNGGEVTIDVTHVSEGGTLALGETRVFTFDVIVEPTMTTPGMVINGGTESGQPETYTKAFGDGPYDGDDVTVYSTGQVKHFVVAAVTPQCGNGRLEGDEQCDDGNITPSDGCNEFCRLTTPANCGNSFLDAAEQCDDGNTIPGDGCNDYCQLEADCGNGVALETLDGGFVEQCDDGNLDNGDGCSSICQVEVSQVTVEKYAVPLSGATLDLNDQVTFTLRLDNPETIDIESVVITDILDSAFQFVSSPDVEVSNIGQFVTINAGTLAAGATDVEYTFIAEAITDVDDIPNIASLTGTPADQVDPISIPSNSTIHFVVDGLTTACGNGRLEGTETCDDGNIVALDGCDASCALEDMPSCGNGIRGDGTDPEGEECDDGNTVPGDGCNDYCQIEHDCGNEVIETPEECDDGNVTAGDECSATCTIEILGCTDATAYNYNAAAVIDDGSCRICGDGTEDTADGETCDDGMQCEDGTTICTADADCTGIGGGTCATRGNDGCDATCTAEVCGDTICTAPLETISNCYEDCGSCGDTVCTDPPETAHTCYSDCGSCGDALCTGLETEDTCYEDCGNCGDAICNATEEDSNSCYLDCGECGNGTKEGPETCDDGNLDNGDGCSAVCGVEAKSSGGGTVRTVIGVCHLTPSLEPQCIGKRPERGDVYWDFYQDCIDKSGLSEMECSLQWAQKEGHQPCGDLAIGFTQAGTIEAAEKCGYDAIEPEPLLLSCQPSHCNDCLFDDPAVSVGVRDPHVADVVYLSEGVHIANKEDVEYKVVVDLELKDSSNYQLRGDIPVRVDIYDYTIPSESAYVWYRDGITNEDKCEESQYGRECWTIRDATAGGKIFSRALTQEEVQNLNSGGHTAVTFEYSMSSDFLFEETYAEILSNVVFATMEFGYDYYDTTLEVWSTETSTVYGIGGNMCDNPIHFEDFLSKESTMGARSSINLHRPMLHASAGESFAPTDLQTSLFGQAVGGEVDTGWTDASGTTTEYYRSLIQNSINISGGVLFDQVIPETETSIYYINSGDVSLIGDLDMHGTSKTFIIEGYNLEILDDFQIKNGFAGFIVLGGDITIANHVEQMEGIFIANSVERNRQIVGGNIRPELGVGKSEVPLTVSGSLIGNVEQIMANRVYIGEYDTEGKFTTQPNLQTQFDIRILDQTPPGLESMRGEEWIQGQ